MIELIIVSIIRINNSDGKSFTSKTEKCSKHLKHFFFLFMVGRHTILFECKGIIYCTNRLLLINFKGKKSKNRGDLKQKLITEPQNRWGWNHCVSPSPIYYFLVKHIHLEQVARVCTLKDFEGETPHCSGQPDSMLCHPQSKTIFPHIYMGFPVLLFVPVAPGAVTACRGDARPRGSGKAGQDRGGQGREPGKKQGEKGDGERGS